MTQERRKIVALNRQSGADALVTLVGVEGSSYRQTGARLLVARTDTGSGQASYAGTISGGCLEAEVVRKASWQVRDGAVLERYSTLFDDTAEIPYGLGCGGTVTLLFEPAGTPEFDALIHALETSLLGTAVNVITWLPAKEQLFARTVLSPDGEMIFSSAGISNTQIAAVLDRSTEDVGNFYVEHLSPPQRLIIFGAGDDAKPLVSMAALLGWTVIVVDGRSQYARPERFPEAARVVTLSARETAALNLSASDAVVLMTHSYEQDREWLTAVLPVAPLYFGVLGARHRSSLLVSEATALAGIPLEMCCERIYAPVGLDLGGDGPEAIALAVIAEAQARCMGRLGSSLRLSAADVATQIEQGGNSRYLKTQCAAGTDPRG